MPRYEELPKLNPFNRVIIHWSTQLKENNPGSPWDASWTCPGWHTSLSTTWEHHHIQAYPYIEVSYINRFKRLHYKFRVLQWKYLIMSLRIQPRREHYMEIVLYFNHRPSALIRSTVHGVEVPKDGLLLRLTCINLMAAPWVQKGTPQGLSNKGLKPDSQGGCIWLVARKLAR